MIINTNLVCALALKTLTQYLFEVFHYLCEVGMVMICVSLRTFYSNKMYKL